MPGFVSVAFMSPLIFWLTDSLPRVRAYEGQLILAAALFAGLALSALSDPIYEFFEGRRWWPSPIGRWRIKAWSDYVDGLLTQAQDKDDPRYHERWAMLRTFPCRVSTDDHIARPCATAPTRLGNILAAHENYPGTRYGMDAVFYWPRLWLTLSKETRDEIEQAWAPADGLIYSAASLALIGFLYIGGAAIFGLLRNLALFLPRGDPLMYALWGLAAFSLALLLYWLSLPAHRENGSRLRSVFDLYRTNLVAMLPAASDDSVVWTGLRERLDYQEFLGKGGAGGIKP